MSALSKFKVQFFGASVDPLADNQAFSEKNSYNFPLLSDPEKTYARALGVLGPAGFANRWTFIIDDQGAGVWLVVSQPKSWKNSLSKGTRLDRSGLS